MSLHSSALCDGGTVLTAVVVHAVHRFVQLGGFDLFREFQDKMFLHVPRRSHLYFDRVHFHDTLISGRGFKGIIYYIYCYIK